MKLGAMKILIIEDDIDACTSFKECVRNRDDIEIVAMTDSDIEGLKHLKNFKPEGVVLDLELNNSTQGNMDSFGFLDNIKNLHLNYDPIIIVTTHVNSKRTYEILHRKGVDLILYKDHPKYSSNSVLNSFINLRKSTINPTETSIEKIMQNEEEKISNLINSELDLIGMSAKLKGRNYIYDAILYLIENEKENGNGNVIQYLSQKYKRSTTTITNGIQNAIVYAWRVTPPDEIEEYYTARVNYETGLPTAMELIYYYVNKVKTMV